MRLRSLGSALKVEREEKADRVRLTITERRRRRCPRRVLWTVPTRIGVKHRARRASVHVPRLLLPAVSLVRGGERHPRALGGVAAPARAAVPVGRVAPAGVGARVTEGTVDAGVTVTCPLPATTVLVW